MFLENWSALKKFALIILAKAVKRCVLPCPGGACMNIGFIEPFFKRLREKSFLYSPMYI